MGIQVEFNPDLCLREFNTPSRKSEECLPEKIEIGKVHSFLKKDFRNYWLMGEIPLRKTEGGEKLSKPAASVQILEVTHFIENGQKFTKGKYLIKDLNGFTFDGLEKKKEKKRPGVGFGVLMFKDWKILLGKRNEDKNKADSELHGEGTWTMPGGKLEFLESFEDGAKREVMEETGIELKNSKVICVNNDTATDAHFITIGLFAEFGKDFFDDKAKIMEPDEITEWKWFSLYNLPKNLFPPSKKVLDNFKLNKFYIEK
ncbi:MAG: NUDIX domain-containing protein [Candidatus Pacearchaeota archaeon]